MRPAKADKTLVPPINKVGYLEYFVIFIMIIFLGNANSLVLLSSVTETPLVFLVLLVLSGILLLRHRVPFNKNFYLLIFCYVVYFLALTIKFKTFYPTFLIHYPIIFFISYVLIKSLKYGLFILFERILYFLAIIGLFAWILQIVMGGDTLYGYFARIPGIHEFSHVTGGGLNLLFYSVQPTSFSLMYNNLPARNCGFAWEPGGFAVYICLAIFINLFFDKSGKGSKRRLWVLLIALLTTQSTTGFIIFIIIGLFYYLNENLKKILLVLPIIILGIVLILSLPFMAEKIVSLAQDVNEVDAIVASGYGRETSVTPQRFASFLIAFKDFYLNPILGTGGFKGESWTSKIGVNISTISGIGNLLSYFGLVGFLFFMIVSYKTSVLYAKHFGYNGRILFFLIILTISVSYGILFMPLIMCFWIFSLFET